MFAVNPEKPLLLIGAGKMGGAMLDGWLVDAGNGASFQIVDPFIDEKMAVKWSDAGVVINRQLPNDIDPALVLIAVKPQMMAGAAPQLIAYKGDDTVFVSVAAGITIGAFEEMLGADARIIRAMPNTPAQVGRGVTVGVANAAVSRQQKDVVAGFLEVTGSYDWVYSEVLIDAVTAVSGSGPAYVFNMVEAMTQAAIEAGLPDELAGKLARGTIVGAGELLHQSSLDAATLRKNVTSPGGTTAAGLAVLMDEKGLTPLMVQAVAAAKKRSEELGAQ